MKIHVEEFAERSRHIAAVHLTRHGTDLPEPRLAAETTPIELAVGVHGRRADDEAIRMVAHGMMLARLKDQFDLVRGEHVGAALSLAQTVESLRYDGLDGRAHTPAPVRLLAADLCSATAELVLQREASELFRLWADRKLEMCGVLYRSLLSSDSDTRLGPDAASDSAARCSIAYPLLMGIAIVNPILAAPDITPVVEEFADLTGILRTPGADRPTHDRARDRLVELESFFDATDLDTDVWRALLRTACLTDPITATPKEPLDA